MVVYETAEGLALLQDQEGALETIRAAYRDAVALALERRDGRDR
jgi:hypothetical protein